MEDAYSFTKRAARQIQKVVRQVERVQPATPPPINPLAQAACYIAKTKAGGIAARSGTTPGSGKVEVYRINFGGTLEAVTDAVSDPLELTVYNICSSAVALESYIQLKQDAWGRYLVDVEDCG